MSHPPLVAFETDLHGAALLPRTVQLECICVSPLALETGFDLVVRLRGAWGQAIRARAANGCPNASALLHACFSRNHIARPYLIDVRTRNIEMIASLTLIGSAHIWQECAFDCFIAAISEHPGIALSIKKGSARVPWRVIGTRWSRQESFEPGPLQTVAALELRRPLRIVENQALATDLSGFLVGLTRRVADLALWSHAQVVPCSGMLADHHGKVRPIKVESAAFWRNSSRSCTKGLHLGLIGSVVVENLSPLGWALIAFGARFGVGQEVALGMGRYDIFK